ESDKSDAPDPDEEKVCCTWTQHHNTQLRLVSRKYNPVLIFSNAGVTRYRFWVENSLSLKSLSFISRHIPSSENITIDL
ncbi:hypothetical protein WUBG_17070, partial [Wuchereria bancrofti]